MREELFWDTHGDQASSAVWHRPEQHQDFSNKKDLGTLSIALSSIDKKAF